MKVVRALRHGFALLTLFGGLVTSPLLGATEVIAEALLPGLAVLRIDGKRVRLRSGETHGAVTLLDATAREAQISINGEQRSLGVSQRISGQFAQPTERSVTIRRDERFQYRTTAEINGVRVAVLVDTGANVVALNRRDARRVGIGDEDGTPSQVQTAGDIVPARSLVLDSVSVGGIRVDGVMASVIDGDFPATILLGMSYLQHVELQEQGGVMTLKARW